MATVLKGRSAGAPAPNAPAPIKSNTDKGQGSLEVHISDLRNVLYRLGIMNSTLNDFRLRVYGEGDPPSEGKSDGASLKQPHVFEINQLQQAIYDEINQLENQVVSLNFLG